MMRKVVHELLTASRIKHGPYGTDESDGNNGCFMIYSDGVKIRIIASTAEFPEAQGWEHVSVSLADRCPTWEEMCFVKSLFWEDEECVVQFHPPKSDYVNCHPHCLHLWKDTRNIVLTPPSILVGPMAA